MAIPDFQTAMLPLLRLVGDKAEWATRDIRAGLAEEFALTADELEELLPSGRQATFTNRVAWAEVYLKQAGLLESPRRGAFVITGAGLKVLESPPDRITIKYLERFPGFAEFRTRPRARRSSAGSPPVGSESSGTPEERLDAAHEDLQAALESAVLERVKQVPPGFFERLVLDLLIKMDYGIPGAEAGKHLGRSGDGGVDGVIRQDRLGLDVVYLQAKRYGDQAVGGPEVRGFAGSLDGKRARKGVLITTSHFTPDAKDFVNGIEKRIVLIDGRELAKLMIEHGVGVTTLRTLPVQRIDEGFFEDAVG